MNVKPMLQSQYRASLAMLLAAIEKSPDALWTSGAYANPCWHIAYQQAFTFLIFGLHEGAASAQRYLADRVAWLDDAQEVWSGILEPFRHHGPPTISTERIPDFCSSRCRLPIWSMVRLSH